MSLLDGLADKIQRSRPVQPVASRPLVPEGERISPTAPLLSEDMLTEMIERADRVPVETRSGGSKQKGIEGYSHVSSLIGACEREQCISYQHGLPLSEEVQGAMKVVWALGRAAEKHVKDGIISSRGGMGVYGVWQCKCGASKVREKNQPDESQRCTRCGGSLNRYAEPLLVDHDHGVIGSPDMTLVEIGWHLAIEIKSMNKEQFDDLKEPLADHILQVMMYRELYRRMGFTVFDYAKIIYVRKDFMWKRKNNSLYKEYDVQAEDWQGQVSALFNRAEVITRNNRTGTLPRRELCSTVDCKKAKSCRRANLCFSL